MLSDLGQDATVLIVDDNAQNRELLAAFFQDSGLRVLEAENGERAIETVRAQNPDAVVLDIMMPRVSGFQVLEQLRSDPQTRDVPVLIVTALNEAADVERTIDAGAKDFLTKPVVKDELVDRVCAQIKLRRTAQELATVRTFPRERAV